MVNQMKGLQLDTEPEELHKEHADLQKGDGSSRFAVGIKIRGIATGIGPRGLQLA